MVVEFARAVFGTDDANSTEFDPETPYPVISLLDEQQGVVDKGGTMRLGSYPCRLVPGTHGPRRLRRGRGHGAPPPPLRVQQRVPRAAGSGGPRRQRHLAGRRRSSRSSRSRDHPFMVGTQFHPELRSRPNRPHPLFAGFVGAAVERSGIRGAAAPTVAPHARRLASGARATRTR